MMTFPDSPAVRRPPGAAARLRTVLSLAAVALLTAACSATSGPDGPEDTTDPPAIGPRSPASERVIGGVAELALSSQAWPGFDEARANRIKGIGDGSPLYVHIRSSRPLGELAHPADPGGNLAFSEYPHLYLQIGDNESLRILATCYVTLTPEETRQRELVVPLAPLTYRPGQIPADCWLATAAAAKPGKRTFEVRLAGFPGRFERWLPVPDLLAVAAVPTDFKSGAAEYATMLKATPLRNATVFASAAQAGALGDAGAPADGGAVSTPIRGSSLVAASPLLPGPRQELAGGRMELQLQTLTAAALGRRPSEAYFVDAQWTGITDARGRVTQQQAFAAAVFKGDICSWQRLRVTRRPGASTLSEVEPSGDPIEVSCSDLP